MNNKRIIAGIIDYIIACIIQAILMFIFFIRPLIEHGDGGNIYNTLIRFYIVTFCSISFLIIKDVLGKKSIGKRIMKLKIVTKNNGSEATFSKRLLRNLTLFLLPIEILILLINKERLGDSLTKTNVVED